MLFIVERKSVIMWVKLSDGTQINLNGVLYFKREMKEITLMNGETIALTTSDAEIIENRIEGNRNRDGGAGAKPAFGGRRPGGDRDRGGDRGGFNRGGDRGGDRGGFNRGGDRGGFNRGGDRGGFNRGNERPRRDFQRDDRPRREDRQRTDFNKSEESND